MATTLLFSMLFAAIFWIAVLIPPVRPTATREKLDATDSGRAADSGEITALIPARNEAATIERTLSTLRQQGPDIEIIVVNDQSTDQTARIVANQPVRFG